MSEILNLLLEKEITVEDIINWLSYKSIKDEARDIFRHLDYKRIEFLPYFLNYLRDQTSNLVQNSQSSGFTPKKPSQNHDSRKPLPNTSSHHKNIRHLPRVQLFPSPESHQNFNSGSSNRVPSVTRNKRRPQVITNIADTHIKHHGGKYDYRTLPKLCLGEYLNSDVITNAQKRKTIQPVRIQKENARYSNNNIFSGKANEDLNLNDFEAFPPFDAVTTKKRDLMKKAISGLERRSINNINVEQENEARETKLTNNNPIHSKSCDSSTKQPTFENENDNELTDLSKANGMQSTSSVEIAHASIEEVTFRYELDLIGALYSSLLDENLIPNISVELYFLIQLLTVRNEPVNNLQCDEKQRFLHTVHNCVYFAVKVLTLQKRILKILDKTTLRLLVSNSRIESFSANLMNFLSEISEETDDRRNIAFSSPIGSVSFQSDTDNKQNFPDDQTFQVFRKQRDLFYEILREWEASHFNPGWSMSINQGEKIRSVVNAWPNPSVYSHLARLFLNQLIAMYKGDVFQDQNNDHGIEDVQLLSDLKCKNPEKFKRLQKRFVAPLHVGGPSPTPSFTGPQEFFWQFIIIANSPAFNQYLIDNIVFKIIQMNNVEISISDESCSFSVDEAVKQKFVSSLTSLRLLAKFLGFLIFSPYKSSERIPQDLQVDNIAVRNKLPLVLDLKLMLTESVQQHRLILTIPWIIEFLSMMDAIALLLDKIQEILIIFLYFYRKPLLELKQKNFHLNYFFLLLQLGWLFEIHNVSSSSVFTSLDESSIDSVIKNYHVSDTLTCLDSMHLIDHHILYACCPYLGELNIILSDFAAGMNNRSSTIKKIIPTSADLQGKASIAERNLQLQLEENFFHNHPLSLKRIVEFVAERMASNVIKHVKKEIIPGMRRESFSKLNEYFLKSVKNKGKIKANFTSVIQEISLDMSANVKSRTCEFLESYCKERIDTLLKLLFCEDISQQVLEISTQIAKRLSKEKIMHWIITYVTPGLFNEELQIEIEKHKKLYANNKMKLPDAYVLQDQKEVSSLPYASFSPTDLIIQIKSRLQIMYTNGTPCTLEEANQTVQDFESLLLPVTDVIPSVKKLLFQLSLEFVIGLVIVHPSLLNQIDYMKMLKNCHKVQEALTEVTIELVSPRNLVFLLRAKNAEESWLAFEHLIISLLKENLLKRDSFERQCLLSLKQEWPKDFLQKFTKCIDNVIKDCGNRTQDCQEFREIKEWLATKYSINQEYDLPRI